MTARVKEISIIGGGLAGLALGILLRQRDVPVSVTEAGTYPRHRVCGEFISGAGCEVLQALSLPGEISPHSRIAQTAAFFDERREIVVRDLPSSAICISRYHLDRALAERFVSIGGVLKVGSRIVERAGRGIVDATGRRARAIDEQGARWVGLKMHVRRVELAADLEIHVCPDAYIGLCRLADNEVNVCGLFRCARGESVMGHDALLGPAASPLRKRLTGAEVDQDSRCAVAGLSLEPQPIDASVCRAGDAVTMIPPITGNGMSMAFESAGIAAEPLKRYWAGEQSWETTTSEIAALLNDAFSRRLTWAARLHAGLFSWLGRRAILPLVCEVPQAWRRAFHVMRR